MEEQPAGSKKAIQTKRLVPAWQKRLNDFVVSLEWSPDGNTLAAATASGEVSLIPRQTGQEIETLTAHPTGMGVLCWHPGKGFLTTAGQDGRVCAWQAGTKAPLWIYQAGRAWVENMVWSPPVPGETKDAQLALLSGKEIHILDSDGVLKSKSDPQAGTLLDLCWHHTERKILTSAYGKLDIWNGLTVKKIKSLEWKGALWNCCWSPDGRWVVGGSQENAVHVWNAQTAEHLHMPGYQAKIKALDWSSDSKWLATGNGIDVLLWDCSGKGPDGRQPWMVGVHSEPVTELKFQHGGYLLAAGGRDGKVVLWKAGGSEEPLAVYMGEDEVGALRWSPDDKLLAVGTAAGDVMLF